MTHESVKSSMIKSIGHDPETNKMEITFTSGKTYEYPDVPAEEFEALRDAPSIGKHFNEYWRNR